jgi:hypothetical protein
VGAERQGHHAAARTLDRQSESLCDDVPAIRARPSPWQAEALEHIIFALSQSEVLNESSPLNVGFHDHAMVPGRVGTGMS